LVEFVVPRLKRAQVTDTAGRLLITISPRRSAAGLLVGGLAVAVGVWLLMHALAASQLYLERPSGAVGDLLIMGFALASLVLAVNATYGLLFEFFGTEEAQIGAGYLRLRRGIRGLGYRASFVLSRVQHLRILDLSRGPYVRGIAIGPSRNGLLAFDYDGRLVRFGDDLELPEAAGILELLEGRMREQPPSLGAA
jgi:hypothetical protein